VRDANTGESVFDVPPPEFPVPENRKKIKNMRWYIIINI
jgi:hypothetical protein